MKLPYKVSGSVVGEEDLEPTASNLGVGQDTAVPQALLPKIYLPIPAKGSPSTIYLKTRTRSHYYHSTGARATLRSGIPPGPKGEGRMGAWLRRPLPGLARIFSVSRNRLNWLPPPQPHPTAPLPVALSKVTPLCSKANMKSEGVGGAGEGEGAGG